jgi:hypothetical protein
MIKWLRILQTVNVGLTSRVIKTIAPAEDNQLNGEHVGMTSRITKNTRLAEDAPDCGRVMMSELTDVIRDCGTDQMVEDKTCCTIHEVSPVSVNNNVYDAQAAKIIGVAEVSLDCGLSDEGEVILDCGSNVHEVSRVFELNQLAQPLPVDLKGGLLQDEHLWGIQKLNRSHRILQGVLFQITGLKSINKILVRLQIIYKQ